MKTCNYAKKKVLQRTQIHTFAGKEVVISCRTQKTHVSKGIFSYNNSRTQRSCQLLYSSPLSPFSVSLCLYHHQSFSTFLSTDSIFVPHTPIKILDMVASELLIMKEEQHRCLLFRGQSALLS